MHQFDYKNTPEQLLTPSIVRQLAILHEYKGKQDLYVSAKADTLSALLNIAKIQSTRSSAMQFAQRNPFLTPNSSRSAITRFTSRNTVFSPI